MDKVSIVHTSKNWKKLAGIHVDEYFVEKIVDHEEQARNFKNWKFCVWWARWLNWNEVKDLAALDTYSQEHPVL